MRVKFLSGIALSFEQEQAVQEVLIREDIITLGTPSVYLSTLKGSDGVHIPPYFSDVSLRFTHAKRGMVSLYSGFHPHLKVSESELKLAFIFDAQRDREDLGKLFERAIIAQVEELLQAAQIKIKIGKRADHLEYGFHYLEVIQETPVKGLHVDPKAIAYREWFE